MWITVEDLTPFVDVAPAKAHAMISDAEALAEQAAPCLVEAELTDPQKNAVRAILRGAILRWVTSGDGAVVQQTAGPFAQTVDNRQPRRTLFWPSEITQLQQVCAAGTGSQKAFSIDTAPRGGSHAATCSLAFGGAYCSCGAWLAGVPTPGVAGNP